ncbi:MAG TPA: hypothetical protein VH351_19085 [Bryobacteraceae bacterium]|jgi:hypothetical protein|nr:hypothetical protein [Bryobacteraceae bacterium]
MIFLRPALLFLVSAMVAPAAQIPSIHVNASASAAWNKVFAPLNIAPGEANRASILVIAGNEPENLATVAEDHIVVLEGSGSAAQMIGITPTAQPLAIRHIVDSHAPETQIVWQAPVQTVITTIPNDFTIFATERWKGAPVLAGKRTGRGAILWVATDPGASGMERYPYLLQALADLGLELPAQTTSLWAFFDSAYRIRADVDYLAKRWRVAGVGVLHVAGWHNMEPDAAQDEYLRKLIEACHRNAILVYVWLELPHVSERFWADHPEWREKTAAGQDAQLDWRKLMNLENPQCRRAIAGQVSNLLNRFDWDGVNLAELYFESLEGASNPARFTPMNDDVRSEFKVFAGFDPVLLFDPASPYFGKKNASALRLFLDFRAVLASRMQSDWLKELRSVRTAKPHLDVVLTHIDDRFDPAIRDELGADVARAMPLIQAQKSTLLVEDPANLWNLGAERYAKLAEKYRELTKNMQSVAVDINVVDRYQDVYPTKKQTGVELFQLVHEAARSFGHVAVYFENSIQKPDLTLLPSAATAAIATPSADGGLQIKSADATRVRWEGPADLDGHPWPVQNLSFVLVPAGEHHLSTGTALASVTIIDFNGGISSAFVGANTVTLSYNSVSRAIAVLGSQVASITVDGQPFWKVDPQHTASSFLLPAGQHIVTFLR